MASDDDKAVPPLPMPQDKGGWRVAPAPDGRGMPEERKPPAPHRLRVVLDLRRSCCWRVNWVARADGPIRRASRG